MKEIVALLAVQIFYAISYPMTSHLLHSMDPLSWATLRATLSAAILAGLCKAYRLPLVPKGMPLARVLLFAVLAVSGNQFLFILGLSLSTATETALLITTIPVCAYALALALGFEKPNLKRALGIFLAVAGVMLLYGRPQSRANIYNLASAVVYGSYLTLASQDMRKYHPLSFVCAIFLAGAPMLVFLDVAASMMGWNPAATSVASALTPTMAVEVAFLVFFGTIAPYTLNSFAGRKLSSSTLAIAVTLQPILTALFVALAVGESLDPRLLLPSALILFGVATTVGVPRPARRRGTAALLLALGCGSAHAASRFGDDYSKLVESGNYDAYPLPPLPEATAEVEIALAKAPPQAKLYAKLLKKPLEKWKWKRRLLPPENRLPSEPGLGPYWNSDLLIATDPKGTTQLTFRPVHVSTGCAWECTPAVFHLQLDDTGVTQALLEDPDMPLRKVRHVRFDRDDLKRALSIAQSLPEALRYVAHPLELTNVEEHPAQTWTPFKEALVPGAAYTSYRIYEAALTSRLALRPESDLGASERERKLFLATLAVNPEESATQAKLLWKMTTGTDHGEKRAALYLLPKLIVWGLATAPEKQADALEKLALEAFGSEIYRSTHLRSYCSAKDLLLESKRGVALLEEMRDSDKSYPACDVLFDRLLHALAADKAEARDRTELCKSLDFLVISSRLEERPAFWRQAISLARSCGRTSEAQRLGAAYLVRFPLSSTAGLDDVPATLLKESKELHETSLKAGLLKVRQKAPRLKLRNARKTPSFPVHGRSVYLIFSSGCERCRRWMLNAAASDASREALDKKLQLIELEESAFTSGSGNVLCREGKWRGACDRLAHLHAEDWGSAADAAFGPLSVPRLIVLDRKRRVAYSGPPPAAGEGRDPLADMLNLAELADK